MVRQFKKFFPIFLALFLGVAIIVVAIKGGSIFGTTISFTAPKEADDSWKSALSVVPGNTSIARVERGSAKVDEPAPYYATTTTDFISRKLVLDYMAFQRSSATTTLSDADAEAIADNLIQEVKLAPGTQYKLSDLNISGDNSDTANATYTKNVTDAMQDFITAHKTNELEVVGEALTAKDGTKLQELVPIIAQYERLKKGLLAVKTPSAIAPLHLRLVQGYSNIQNSIVSMQKMFSDSVLGFAALAQYQNGLSAIDEIGTEYKNYTPAQ